MTRPAGPDDDPHTIAREIAGAVDSLATLWSLAAQGAALRLSPHQLRALTVLEAAPGLNLTALAQRLDIGPPTASRLCDRLEAAGLLEREAHPHRRREVRLRPSARGRRVLAEVADLRTGALASALAGLEPDDRAAIRRGLNSLFPTGGTFHQAGDASPAGAPYRAGDPFFRAEGPSFRAEGPSFRAEDSSPQAGTPSPQAGTPSPQAGDPSPQAGDSSLQAGDSSLQAGTPSPQAGGAPLPPDAPPPPDAAPAPSPAPRWDADPGPGRQ